MTSYTEFAKKEHEEETQVRNEAANFNISPELAVAIWKRSQIYDLRHSESQREGAKHFIIPEGFFDEDVYGLLKADQHL